MGQFSSICNATGLLIPDISNQKVFGIIIEKSFERDWKPVSMQIKGDYDCFGSVERDEYNSFKQFKERYLKPLNYFLLSPEERRKIDEEIAGKDLTSLTFDKESEYRLCLIKRDILKYVKLPKLEVFESKFETYKKILEDIDERTKCGSCMLYLLFDNSIYHYYFRSNLQAFRSLDCYYKLNKLSYSEFKKVLKICIEFIKILYFFDIYNVHFRPVEFEEQFQSTSLERQGKFIKIKTKIHNEECKKLKEEGY